jgi:hypothetical protein
MNCKTCVYTCSAYRSRRSAEKCHRSAFDVKERMVKAFNDIGKDYIAMVTLMTTNIKASSV